MIVFFEKTEVVLRHLVHSDGKSQYGMVIPHAYHYYVVLYNIRLGHSFYSSVVVVENYSDAE